MRSIAGTPTPTPGVPTPSPEFELESRSIARACLRREVDGAKNIFQKIGGSYSNKNTNLSRNAIACRPNGAISSRGRADKPE